MARSGLAGPGVGSLYIYGDNLLGKWGQAPKYKHGKTTTHFLQGAWSLPYDAMMGVSRSVSPDVIKGAMSIFSNWQLSAPQFITCVLDLALDSCIWIDSGSFLPTQGWLAVCAVAACSAIALCYARSLHSLPDTSERTAVASPLSFNTDRLTVCRNPIIHGSVAFRLATTGEFLLQIAWLWAAAGEVHGCLLRTCRAALQVCDVRRARACRAGAAGP